MAQVLEIRLRESLREDLGGTYSVSASANYSKIPREEYTITIGFGCSPDRTDELIKGVFKEIEQLKTNGPTDKQVADVKETFLRDQETNMKQNGYLLTQIAVRYQYRRRSRQPLQNGRLLQQDRRRDDQGSGADVSEGGQFREGHVVP